MAVFHLDTFEETANTPRDISMRSVRAFVRSPYDSGSYRLQMEQIERELKLIETELSSLDSELDDTVEIIVEGGIIAVVYNEDVTADPEYTATVGDIGIDYIDLPGIQNLVADLMNLDNRVTVLENGN